MHRPFRCPVLMTAAVIGGATLAIVVYYYWSRPKKTCTSQCNPSTSSTSTASEVTSSGVTPSDGGRAGAGKEGEESSVMFNFDDAHVRQVCEKLFLEQMDLGEAFMEDEDTIEMGAVHMANAIALTGEANQLLKVLRRSIPPANYACIQKYLPTADMRINQLLQDELAIETIEEHFG